MTVREKSGGERRKRCVLAPSRRRTYSCTVHRDRCGTLAYTHRYIYFLQPSRSDDLYMGQTASCGWLWRAPQVVPSQNIMIIEARDKPAGPHPRASSMYISFVQSTNQCISSPTVAAYNSATTTTTRSEPASTLKCQPGGSGPLKGHSCYRTYKRRFSLKLAFILLLGRKPQ